MLYTLSNSPYSCDLTAMVRVACLGDDLLLLSDGVIAGINGSSFLSLLISSPFSLYALKNDVNARGLYSYISYNISIIDYTYFVKLTERQLKQISW